MEPAHRTALRRRACSGLLLAVLVFTAISQFLCAEASEKLIYAEARDTHDVQLDKVEDDILDKKHSRKITTIKLRWKAHSENHLRHHAKSRRPKRSVLDTVVDHRPRLVDFALVNAAPRSRPCSFYLHPSANRSANFSVQDLRYGESRQTKFPLSLYDQVVVSDGIEMINESVSKSIVQVPEKAESFVVIDESEKRHLDTTFTIFDVGVDVMDSHVWLFTHNSLLHPRGEAGTVFHGIDVIAFNADLAGIDISLHRIAKNISLHHGQEATLPEGQYEIKVLPHGQVNDVNQFKNTKPLLPAIHIKLQKTQRHFISVQGVLTSKEHPPSIVSVPEFTKAIAWDLPHTKVVAVNSYDREPKVLVSFPKQKVNVSLSYGNGSLLSMELHKGDMFLIQSEQAHYTSAIQDEVPYGNGICAMYPDKNMAGQLETFFTCWHLDSFILAPGYFWLFTYDAMMGITEPVDVIIFDESALDSKTRHSLYCVADRLRLAEGVSSIVEVGNYSLKVVPHNTVHNTDEFMAAESLIAPLFIQPHPQQRYYGALQGDTRSNSGQYRSFPPMSNTHTAQALKSYVPTLNLQESGGDRVSASTLTSSLRLICLFTFVAVSFSCF